MVLKRFINRSLRFRFVEAIGYTSDMVLKVERLLLCLYFYVT